MRRLLRLPLGAARTAWSFVNPSRTTGRVPLGRVAIVAQLVAALIFLGYTLSKKSIHLPFASEPYEVQVIFPDAQGLDRLDEPAAAVAGTPLGTVSRVEYRDGQALVTLRFDSDVRGKIYRDASASIRPASALQNLLVNVDPGTPAKGPLPDGKPIGADHTAGYVTIDELTSVLDTDTQAYISILLEQAHIAVHGREGELRQALAKLDDVVGSAQPLARALAERRQLLARLVGDLEVIGQTLGRRQSQLATAVNAANATVGVTAARERELASVTRRLAPVLVATQSSLTAARKLAVPLVPALDQLATAAGPLSRGLVALRGLLPRAKQSVGGFAKLVHEGRRPLNLMVRGTRGLRGRARRIVPVMRSLTSLARRLDTYKQGIPQTADTLSSAFSSQDRNGPYIPIDVLKSEQPTCENFGLPVGCPQGKEHGRYSRLDLRLARALEVTCAYENPLACLMRFSSRSLPPKPVVRGLPWPRQGGAG